MKTRWIVLVVIMVALGVAGMLGPALWEMAVHKKVWFLETNSPGDKTALGFRVVGRFSGERVRDAETSWFEGTGFVFHRRNDEVTTFYAPMGKVFFQYRDVGGKLYKSPPWLNGVTDQTTSTAPWITMGLTASEFWEQVKEPGEPTLEEFLAEHQK